MCQVGQVCKATVWYGPTWQIMAIGGGLISEHYSACMAQARHGHDISTTRQDYKYTTLKYNAGANEDIVHLNFHLL